MAAENDFGQQNTTRNSQARNSRWTPALTRPLVQQPPGELWVQCVCVSSLAQGQGLRAGVLLDIPGWPAWPACRGRSPTAGRERRGYAGGDGRRVDVVSGRDAQRCHSTND